MPKVGMPSAGGEDEIVVIKYQIVRFYFSGFDIHGFYLGEDDFDVFAFAQDCAHRGGNVGRRERRCRHLV
jgi:hypothetical protein